MNAQHTQGRLVVRGGYSIYADDGKTPVADTCLTASLPANDGANARRLVACWNALIDLPQEALDGGWTRTGLEAHGLRMEKERNELLALLNGILKCERGMLGHLFLEGWQEQVIRDAIAKHQPAPEQDERTL